MSNKITIKYGEYKNAPIINQEFTLVKGFQRGKSSSQNETSVKHETMKFLTSPLFHEEVTKIITE